MSDQDKILSEAKERFQYALTAASQNREKAKSDQRFAAASPDDPWQWQDTDIQARKIQQRPTLTINKMPQHIRQVTNDVRMNRPSIRYRPADSKADPEVADILMGLVRHIESNSDADIAYDTACENQVTHGLGYIRVVADYISEESFDQDIFIRRVKDPFKCLDDPDIQDPSGADRRFFFIEESLSESEFKLAHPKADPIDWNVAQGDWFSRGEKKIRLAEYFSAEEVPATLLLWANGETSFKGEQLPQGVFIGEQPVKTRNSYKCKVMWRLLNGQQVIEEKEFPCKYIPVARVVGNEWIVEGRPIISGIVRAAKDSQRMYNAAQSAIVERVMMTPKAPWVAPADAIRGYESEWQTANTKNHSFLPYNHTDDNENPIPAPNRTQPTSVEPGLAQIASGAADDIKSETGQYDASLGQRSNETSGRAIMARQREGDTATYHYVDNLARGVRHIGRIILDMIPKVLDTARIVRIVGEDGVPANVQLDPQAQDPITEYQDEKGAIQRIFNPNVGTYDVYTNTGPSFTTRRIEAVEAMTQMTQANPQLWGVIGDQLVKSMDWPGAEEMADRLKLTLIPPVQEMLNKDEKQPEVPPQIQQAMQKMDQQMQMMQHAGESLEKENIELKNDSENKERELKIKEVEANTKAYDAITKRLHVLGPLLTPDEVASLVVETKREALEQADPGMPPSESMGIPEEMPPDDDEMQMQPEQPPTEGGFFMPEDSPQEQPQQQFPA
jgi:hypothetical protein